MTNDKLEAIEEIIRKWLSEQKKISYVKNDERVGLSDVVMDGGFDFTTLIEAIKSFSDQ